ncbi:MAG: GNAT family protein [Erythrobacter sp.]|uniref:GNAT family N-acetyltransferase n=1 Tax=Sulfitobacter pontiacus TaxID=60137 RepID=UPI00327ED850
MRNVAPITTARFTMRPLQRSDTAALFPTLSDEEQCQYLTRPAFDSEEELWGWLAEPGWNGRSWIAEDATGAVVGRFVAVPGHAAGIEEVGYITCIDRQGEGIASECTHALIERLFAEDARKITAEVDTRNMASIALLERLGFTREAHLREHDVTHIGLCDVYWYGLLASSRVEGG